MIPQGTLLLKQREVAGLLTLADCIERVEIAFRQHASGKSHGIGLLNLESGEVEFHIKAGGLELAKNYFALKVNGSCFSNRERFRLPNIMGVIILFDGESGYPLAVLDSIEITIKRTGAATAVAAKFLAQPDSAIATICGCGNQGRIQLEALTEILTLRRIYAFDDDFSRAQSYAQEMSKKLSLEVIATRNLREALSNSQIVVTCTPSKKSFLPKSFVQPGTMVAAVGADSPDKQEIDPGLMFGNKVVVDLLDQCAKVGELHHALEEKLLTVDEVYAELGEIVLGKLPGRTSREEIIVYDATGTAMQDVAVAALAYERAVRSGVGSFFNFFDISKE